MGLSGTLGHTGGMQEVRCVKIRKQDSLIMCMQTLKNYNIIVQTNLSTVEPL